MACKKSLSPSISFGYDYQAYTTLFSLLHTNMRANKCIGKLLSLMFFHCLLFFTKCQFSFTLEVWQVNNGWRTIDACASSDAEFFITNGRIRTDGGS